MYLQVKKDTKYLTRKINQLIACTNAEIERGRGGKRFFPPTKEIGTREGDRSGEGKYFPYCKWNRFFICGGKYCQNRRQKNAPSELKGKSTEKLTRQKPVLSHKAREKGGQWRAEKQLKQGEKFFYWPWSDDPSWLCPPCSPALTAHPAGHWLPASPKHNRGI